MHKQILREYDSYAKSLRQKYNQAVNSQHNVSTQLQESNTTTSSLYRRMKFLPKQQTLTYIQMYSGIPRLEKYIETTKLNLNTHLSLITKNKKTNMSREELEFLKKLKRSRNSITIKQADKNLGIVLMDTDDYVQQCTRELAKGDVYVTVQTYPEEDILKQLTNTIINFKNQLQKYDDKLYHFLLPKATSHHHLPQMYGIPKIHKPFTRVPPIRPIISQSASLLKPIATFLDHILQPLAKSYPDYLHNSTSLSLKLQNLQVPKDAILVSVDVESLFPSIPQTDMLETIYQEMHKKRHLLIFDPNLIVRLLHINVNNNFFEFANCTFKQTKGMAMGSPCSPTTANIYMSVEIRKFLNTQKNKPLLLARYIDDIFIVWTKSAKELDQFMSDLNKFNKSLHYTHQLSTSSIDFLDLTIYKGSTFPYTNVLDTRTFQKPQNLYQYLHYSSNHPKALFKAIITGELTRYVRTNTKKELYTAMAELLTQRLLTRGYPKPLIQKTRAKISYENRDRYLQSQTVPPPKIYPPLYKCLPPPQFLTLKKVILNEYNLLEGKIPSPRFITYSHRTLRKELVRSKLIPTDEQFIDICLTLQDISNPAKETPAQLPTLKTQQARIRRCNHPKCLTCKHLNCSNQFTSTKTKTTYTIRHSFSCTSTNLIYLITCKKCKKQYVGFTMLKLNTRINHHRSNILNNKPIYISVHFNFPDHSINDLSVQPIDTVEDKKCPLEELRKLERFWIKTLKTTKPHGLNLSSGFVPTSR